MCLTLIMLTTPMLSLMRWAQYILCLSLKPTKYKDSSNFYIESSQKNLSHLSMILSSLYVFILRQKKSPINIEKRDIFTQCFHATKICRKARIFLMFLNYCTNATKFIRLSQNTQDQNTTMSRLSTVSYKIYISNTQKMKKRQRYPKKTKHHHQQKFIKAHYAADAKKIV